MKLLMSSTNVGAASNLRKPPSPPHVSQNPHVCHRHQQATISRLILIVAILRGIIFALHPLDPKSHPLATRTRTLSLLIIEVECRRIFPPFTIPHRDLPRHHITFRMCLMLHHNLIRSLGFCIYPYGPQCRWEWNDSAIADHAREEGTIMSVLGESEIVATAD